MNLVEQKYYTANIRPGYILMHEGDYLNDPDGPNKNGTNPLTDRTMHSKLLQDFTGKKLGSLINDKTFYIGWGFSYQEKGSFRHQIIHEPSFMDHHSWTITHGPSFMDHKYL